METDALIECLRNLAATVRQRGIGSTALAMLPIEQLPDDAPVPEPLLLLFNANMSPEATAELLERAALRRCGQPVPAVEGAPEEMLARLDDALELIASHLERVLANAASTPAALGINDVPNKVIAANGSPKKGRS
jgi:hypothetical protein